MTYASFTGLHASPGAKSFADRFGAAIRRLTAAWAAARRRRRQLRMLSGLSERTLADLGVTRAELQSIVYYGGADRTRRARGTPIRRPS